MTVDADMSHIFDPVLDRLTGPALDRLGAGLGAVPGLAAAEREAVRAATAAALNDVLRRKVTRVLVLEVNAARLAGRLTATDPAGRWHQWLDAATGDGFWDSVARRYPTLADRVGRLIAARCAAALEFAGRFAADRTAVTRLLPPGEVVLDTLSFGAGDSHRGGRTVAIAQCATGRLVYKPRSVRVDAALGRLLPRLLPEEPPATRIRVPAVIDRGDYGWAAYEAHRYCSDETERRAFYRGLGHWLAVMLLLGGRDLHAENVIAVGPVPVVVDCEALFTPRLPAPPSGYGLAVDRAARLVDGSVLRTGLLPGRGMVLGWRGVDVSAAGALPGQQPAPRMPVLVDAGTDRVRVGFAPVPIRRAGNHPCPEPVLGRYWDEVVDGFETLSAVLRGLDRTGELAAMLSDFAECPVRLVLRDSESYAELGRMLWHPISLHDEPAARDRAAALLRRQSENLPGAPGDPAVIDAEIEDLLVGDIPMFTTTPAAGWEGEPDLVAAAVANWRASDLDLDREAIRATLASAYLAETWGQDSEFRVACVRADDRDRRRRALAAAAVGRLVATAIRAEDGTATWISPVLLPTGWVIQPLGSDLYAGLSGVAVALAGYQREVEAGRAEPVEPVPALFAAVLRTIRAAADRAERERGAGFPIRPAPPGGYTGLGSQLCAWLLLYRGGVAGQEGLARARALARLLPEAVAAAETVDLLGGVAGAIVPLLRLAELDGDRHWITLAGQFGSRLVAAADWDGGLARWRGPTAPDGLGGVAHGATGVGWALARLAEVTGDPEAGRVARAAFQYEQSLYDPALPGWRDLRKLDRAVDAASWCHGAGGIGIVAADLLRRTGDPQWAEVLGRAAAVCWQSGMGISHTTCHGDPGNWELLAASLAAGVAPPGLEPELLDGYLLTGLEDHGAVTGQRREGFRPGLLTGISGIAYQLLRMHPHCPLPSVLLPDPAPHP